MKIRSGGGIGRHEGLKIPWPVMAVRVRLPSGAQFMTLILITLLNEKL